MRVETAETQRLHLIATRRGGPADFEFLPGRLIRRSRHISPGRAFTMAASCVKPLAAICCLLAICSLCNAQGDKPKPDVTLSGVYQNITDVAAFAASSKECSANDTLCQALKELLIPPPPPAFPPGPSGLGYCRKCLLQKALCLQDNR